MLLSWTRMEESSPATMQPIVPAAGRGHVRPLVPPHVNRLGLSLPLGPPIHLIGFGRAPGKDLSNTCTCARPGHVRSECTSSEPPQAGPRIGHGPARFPPKAPRAAQLQPSPRFVGPVFTPCTPHTARASTAFPARLRSTRAPAHGPSHHLSPLAPHALYHT
jgi:hypothetical protein